MHGIFLDCPFGSNFHPFGLCLCRGLSWISCVSVSLLRRVAGGINGLKPARCLSAVVMWVVEEREMKLLYCL